MILTGDRDARMFCDAEGCPVSIHAIGGDTLDAVDHLHDVALVQGWIVGEDLWHYCNAHQEEES